MAKMITENTYGSHIYAKMLMDNGKIEEIDVYIRESGTTYKTSQDGYNDTERQTIIDTFNELY